MNFFHSLFLAIIQGVTEFLPVSSSGHLVMFQHLLDFQGPHQLFDVILHFGTLLSILIYYRIDLKLFCGDCCQYLFKFRPFLSTTRFSPKNNRRMKENFRLMLQLGLATFCTFGVFLFGKPLFEAHFSSLKAVGFFFLITGCLLFSTFFAWRPEIKKKSKPIGFFLAAIIGLIQGLAIFPGISRSGVTISFAILLGISPEKGAKFSFFLAIPAILGAVGYQLLKINRGQVNLENSIDGQILLIWLLSTAVAALVGFLALKYLIGFLKDGKFYLFSLYMFGIGHLTLLWALFG